MKDIGTAISNKVQFKSVIDRFEVLLREQLDLARKGNISKVEILAGEAQELVGQMSKSKFFAEPQFRERRKGLEQLYNQICLALSAQMDDVSQALARIHKGKKTITSYRDNI
jgi:hypothetical protein